MYKHDIVLFIFPLIIIFTVRIGGELLASVFAWQSRNVYLQGGIGYESATVQEEAAAHTFVLYSQ